MTKIYPSFNILFLNESNIDLYLKRVSKAMGSIPHGILNLEYNCSLVIIDFLKEDAPEWIRENGIVLGSGYYHSDYPPEIHTEPSMGIVFKPSQIESNIREIIIPNPEDAILKYQMPSFMIGKERFFLSRRVFNLDETVCRSLATGEIYKRVKLSKEFP